MRKSLGVFALAGLAVSAWAGIEASRRTRAVDLVVVVTNEVRGRDRRCGCQGAGATTTNNELEARSLIPVCSCKMRKVLEVERLLPDLGALPERSAWVQSVRAEGPLLQLDCGDLYFSKLEAVDVERPEWRRHAELMAEAYGILGVQAVAVGELDLALGKDDLLAVTSHAPFTTVSANLIDAKTQQPIFPGHTTVVIEAAPRAIRVGVIGLFEPPASDALTALLAREGLAIKDPAAALRGEIEALSKQGVELVVLLAHAPDGRVRELVRTVSGVDLAFASHAEVISNTHSLMEGKTAVALALRGGGAPLHARVTLVPGASGIEDAGTGIEARDFLKKLEEDLTHRLVPERNQATDPARRAALDEEISQRKRRMDEVRATIPTEPRHVLRIVADRLEFKQWREGQDPRLNAALDRFKKEVQDLTIAPDVASRLEADATTPDGRVLGYRTMAQCGNCHQAQAQVWSQSPHARAWEALQRGGNEKDPECVRCHTVGFRQPGGFAAVKRSVRPLDDDHADVSLDFRNVQCEACHGPRASHPDPRVKRGSLPDLTVCKKCHDPEHDPYFSQERVQRAFKNGVKLCVKGL